MSRRIAAIIMAAGKSTRMKSALPKAAHPVRGKPVTRWVVDACLNAGINDVVVVVGYEADLVKSAIGDDVVYAYQLRQMGTGHAVMQAMPVISEDVTDIVVLPGDAPLICGETLELLLKTHATESNSSTLLTATLDDAGSYGRVVRSSGGAVTGITEAKDATPEIIAIKEINTSMYCFDKVLLSKMLENLSTDNAQGEYYLTDVIKHLNDSGYRVGAVAVNDPNETLGINDRAELANADAIMRDRINKKYMMTGVTIVDPATTYIDCDVEIGRDTVVYPCTVIERGSRIGSNCTVGPFSRITGESVADGAKV